MALLEAYVDRSVRMAWAEGAAVWSFTPQAWGYACRDGLPKKPSEAGQYCHDGRQQISATSEIRRAPSTGAG